MRPSVDLDPAGRTVPAPPRTNRRVTFTDYGGPEVITVVTEPSVAAPGKGMARVRVEASNLVFTDMLIRRNFYPLRKTLPGETLGYDLVGRVESLGPDTVGPAPGTRVAALTQVGGGQDWANVPVERLVPVRDDVDPVQVEPLVLSYMTAYQSLTREARVRPGDRILVLAGTGAVGLAALDLARAMGLRATCVASSARRALVERMGAEFVAYDQPDAGGGIDRAARQAGGFAVILDGAAAEPLRVHLRRLAPGGHYVGFGFTSHVRRKGLDMTGLALLWGKLRLGVGILPVFLARWRNRNVHFYDITERLKAHPDWFRDDLTTLVQMLSEGSIAPHIAGIFPPERAREAHVLIEEGSVTGRLVLALADRPADGHSPSEGA